MNDDPRFWQEQRERRYAPHVEPINRLVDSLARNGRRAPYVAPYHGGIDATILFLLRSPGRDVEKGSGFLCTRNRDQSARRLANLMDRTGIRPADCLGWNAHPWYAEHSKLTAQQREAGLEPLATLLGLLPSLKAVLLLGNDAQDSWLRLEVRYPTLAARFRTVPTRAPGPTAFRNARDSEERAQWQAAQLSAFEKAAAIARA